jgi:hypothetical protein
MPVCRRIRELGEGIKVRSTKREDVGLIEFEISYVVTQQNDSRLTSRPIQLAMFDVKR